MAMFTCTILGSKLNSFRLINLNVVFYKWSDQVDVCVYVSQLTSFKSELIFFCMHTLHKYRVSHCLHIITTPYTKGLQPCSWRATVLQASDPTLLQLVQVCLIGVGAEILRMVALQEQGWRPLPFTVSLFVFNSSINIYQFLVKYAYTYKTQCNTAYIYNAEKCPSPHPKRIACGWES